MKWMLHLCDILWCIQTELRMWHGWKHLAELFNVALEKGKLRVSSECQTLLPLNNSPVLAKYRVFHNCRDALCPDNCQTPSINYFIYIFALAPCVSSFTCYNDNCTGTGNIHAMSLRNKLHTPCIFIIQSHPYLVIKSYQYQ